MLKRKNNHSVIQPSSDETSISNSGGFATGLSLGLVFGAAGYFLFGTQRGKKMRSKLESEWKEAQVYLKKQGVLKNEGKDDLSFAQFLSSVKAKTLKNFGYKTKKENKSKQSQTKKKYRRSSKTKSDPKQFKGV